MYLTLKLDAMTEDGVLIPAGSRPRYIGHVIGGMVEVFWVGCNRIIHPETTVELSSQRVPTGKWPDEDNGK